MQKKHALLFAALAPALYYALRAAVYAVASALIWANIRASGQEGEWAANQARLALRVAQPWLLAGSALLTVLLAALLFRGAPLARFVGLARPRPASLLALAEMGLGLNVALTALVIMLPLPEGWFAEYGESVSDPLGASGLAVKLLCTVIAAPVAEEVVFRGLSQRFLQRAFPPWVAVVGPAVLFALFHGAKLQMLYVFPAGIILGLVYQWSGTLIAPIILHMAFNMTSELSIPLPGTLWGRLLCLLGGAAIVQYGLLREWRRAR